MVNTLTVYKASAGSGKTFRLAVEYMKLLIADPGSYRRILAVTFTNKATEEMKMRILSQLYGLSRCEVRGARCEVRGADSDTLNYLKILCEEMGVEPEFVRERSAIALHNLLHNYSYFRVETIDSFFQSVLRNLARELDLSTNLRVELNAKAVEQKAVDNLVESLTANSVELSWIMSYIAENMSDDKSWNVIREMKSFGENIFKEVYQQERSRLNDILHNKDFFKRFIDRLYAVKKDAESRMRGYATTFFDVLDAEGLSLSDFSGGERGVAGYFVKLRKGIYDDKIVNETVRQALDNPMRWLKKADQHSGSKAYAAVMGGLEVRDARCEVRDANFEARGLQQLLLECENLRPHYYCLYKSVLLTLRHLNALRLLNSIDKQIRLLTKSTNCFMLSDTQALLNALISDSDSPFIFEKIGTQIEHIMIDEFQDTSTIQWKNFKILLKECMSHSGSRNLIVGDVKQSIYRWRSGDWRLLNNIGSEFSEDEMSVVSLQTNYRSAKTIIDFNNWFFTTAKEIEAAAIAEEDPTGAAQLERAYEDVVQKGKEDVGRRTFDGGRMKDERGTRYEVRGAGKEDGYVRVELFSGSDYHDATLEKLKTTIVELLEMGIQPKDIAILVRSNKTIQHIADYLMQELPGVSLVSDEAFRLDSSLAVRVLVEAMRGLVNPTDKLTRAFLAKAYQQVILGNMISDSELFAGDIDAFMPHRYVADAETLCSMPVYDMCERLYTLFQLHRLDSQGAYVCSFFDKLNKYLTDYVADLTMFLTAWDEDLHSKPIQTDGQADGIRLLTIHKSKGLEFDTVLMPFCDWKLELSTLVWCKPRGTSGEVRGYGGAGFGPELSRTGVRDSDDLFRELPLIPIDYNGAQMKGTVYDDDYHQEHLQNTVDNLNLLYVAFTRARRNLFVWGKSGQKGIRSKIIEDVLRKEEGGRLTDEGGCLTFEVGTRCEVRGTRFEETSTNVFKVKPEPIDVPMCLFENSPHFLQSNRSRQFVAAIDEERGTMKEEGGRLTDEGEVQSVYIEVGNVMHAVLSSIGTLDDIPAALRSLEAEGILYNRELSSERLSSLLQQRLSDPRVSDWFSGRWQLFNECSILFVDPTTDALVERRPDRVMTDGNETIVVDFKFGTPKDEHVRQVNEYMSLLREMGHQNVKGYLWYVYSNQIIEVRGERYEK